MATPPILLPLWPRPNVTETLEWLTDIILSENGSEERTEMRTAPRQSFSYTYFVPVAQRARIANIVYGGRKLQWYVPVWPQVQQIGVVSAAATSIACETRYSEFRDGGLLMLWESPEKYQILEIDAVTSDTNIDLAEETDAFTDAVLMPVRVGRLTGDPSRAFNGRTSVLEMAYAVDDQAELTVAAPTQYLSADAYFDPGLLDSGTLNEGLQARIDVFDEGLGQVSYLAPWTFNRPRRVHRMMAEDAAEAWTVREFLHRRRGRSVAFWQPSFEADLRVTSTGTINATMRVRADDYIDYAEDRTHIAVETASGWLPRAISNPIDLGGGEIQLTVSPSLGVAASTIKRVCYMGLKRLDTDRAEIAYMGGTVSQCAVNTVEIQP